MFGFSWLLPLSLVHSSHCWGVSLPDYLGCHCLWTRTDKVGWQPTPVSSCITEGKKQAHLLKSTNPYSAGLCHVCMVDKRRKVKSLELAEYPVWLGSSSLSLPPFLLSFPVNVQRVILPNRMQFTAWAAYPLPMCTCVYLCVHTCVWWMEVVGRM